MGVEPVTHCLLLAFTVQNSRSARGAHLRIRMLQRSLTTGKPIHLNWYFQINHGIDLYNDFYYKALLWIPSQVQKEFCCLENAVYFAFILTNPP